MFIGYSCGQKGWRVYNVKNGDIFVSRDIMFCEEFFPFSKKPKDGDPTNTPECVEHENFPDLGVNTQNPAPVPIVSQHTRLDVLERQGPHKALPPGLMHAGLQGRSTERGSNPPALPGLAAAVLGPGASPGLATLPGPNAPEPVAQPGTAASTGPTGFSGLTSSGPRPIGPSASDNTVSQGSDPTAESANPRAEKRPIKKPSHLTDYFCYSVQSKNPSSSTQPHQRVSSGNPYPIVDYVACDRFSNGHKNILLL